MLKQPNPWSCLPTAFAIASRLPLQAVLEAISHDGSEIVWPGLDEPYCRKGFNFQEISIAGLLLGWAVIVVHRNYCVTNSKAKHTNNCTEKMFTELLNKYDGVLVDDNHAYAKLDGIIYDPKTGRKTSPRIIHKIRNFLIIRKIVTSHQNAKF